MIGLKYIKQREPERVGSPKKRYEPEYRVKLAVEAIELGNVSAIARKYDVPTQTLDNWVAKVKSL